MKKMKIDLPSICGDAIQTTRFCNIEMMRAIVDGDEFICEHSNIQQEPEYFYIMLSFPNAHLYGPEVKTTTMVMLSNRELRKYSTSRLAQMIESRLMCGIKILKKMFKDNSMPKRA